MTEGRIESASRSMIERKPIDAKFAVSRARHCRYKTVHSCDIAGVDAPLAVCVMASTRSTPPPVLPACQSCPAPRGVGGFRPDAP